MNDYVLVTGSRVASVCRRLNKTNVIKVGNSRELTDSVVDFSMKAPVVK